MSTVSPEILARIRKLLALSTSPNEAEAALAASRAQELLLRHNLDIGVVQQTADEHKATRGSTDRVGRRSAFEFVVANAVDELLDEDALELPDSLPADPPNPRASRSGPRAG